MGEEGRERFFPLSLLFLLLSPSFRPILGGSPKRGTFLTYQVYEKLGISLI